MLTPLQALNSFASRLSCIHSSIPEQEEMQVSSLASLLFSSLSSPNSTVSFPSLWLGPANEITRRRSSSSTSFDDLRVSHWMSQPVSFEGKVTAKIPQALLRNVTSSFSAVVRQKRNYFVRSSMNFLAKNKARRPSGWDATIRLAALEKLSKTPIFQISAVVTRIRSMPLSRGCVEEITGANIGLAELPLTFSVEIQVTVFNQQKVNIVMHIVHGKIRGQFRLQSRNLMESIELELDTALLYRTMKDRATSLVKIADIVATEQVKAQIKKNKEQTQIAHCSTKSSPASEVCDMSNDKGWSNKSVARCV